MTKLTSLSFFSVRVKFHHRLLLKTIGVAITNGFLQTDSDRDLSLMVFKKIDGDIFRLRK